MEWSKFAEGAKKGGGFAMEVFVVEAVPLKGMKEIEPKLKEHLDYLHKLEGDGALIVSGPMSDDTGEEMAGSGLIVLRASSLEEAQSMAHGDPLYAAGIRDARVRRWMMNEGRIDVSIRLSEQSAEVT